MAEEKILNTRIQLKYDSYANWQTNNPTLLAGEIAIAKLTNVTNTTTGTAATEGDQHPVLFKVGPGKFNDLPWVSALAADVHTWAKKSEADFIAWVNKQIEHPVLSIEEATQASVPETATVDVYANLTASGHTLTEELVQVATAKGVSEAIAENEIFETEILTVNALGGIAANTDLNGLTTHAILTKLLFPYVAQVVDTPSRTPNSTTLEKGNNQTITSVSVKVTKKSEAITSVALYNGSVLLGEKTGTEVAAGGTFTFSGLSVNVPSTNIVLTVKVTDASGNVVSKNTAGWTFVYPYYYGVCAEGATIDEALVEGLTKKIESKGNKTNWAFTCDNQCMVFAYPKAHGNLTKIIDPNNFDITGSFTKHEVNITGLDGTTQAYYVYVNGASTVSNFQVDFNY